MVYKIIRSEDVERDLSLLFDHLLDSYLAFGDELTDALERASARLRSINKDIELPGHAPFQGTLSPHLLRGVRSVTKNRAIFYFEILEDRQQVKLLAVFFGAQDHQRHMLNRFLTRRPNEKG
ncbi:type II toxin-antitoxin system RelE/ParE family toxin [Agrobacterium rosae]|uniref:type II toxin-antitoxin system RelE/ParE family toxin n=1 Tax=Agrobacterium rosae TaxID=1972867 RepID=UPI003BA0911B